MDIDQAKRILDVSEEDDKTVIKKKFRRLMGRFHPDAIGSDRPEHIRKAQELNEAYRLLRNEDVGQIVRKKKPVWKGEYNPSAFCERNIYLYYSMETEETKGLYYRAARGKYMWDPLEEEFHLFLTSIHYVSKELLEKIEERAGVVCDEELHDLRFRIQPVLVYYLAQQFIHPVKVLRKIEVPVKKDKNTREIYLLPAFLGRKGYDPVFKALEKLKKGDCLIPRSFQKNKILIEDRAGQQLGHLSFEEDYLYFVVIPLLKRKMAQVEITVRDVKVKKNHRPYQVKVDLDFYFRLQQEAQQYQCSISNEQIETVLGEYRHMFT